MSSLILNEIKPLDARILVVEDDRASADLLCEELRMVGYCVQPAYTKEEAFQMVESFRPHLVVVDLVLGRGDKNNGTKSGLKVIDHIEELKETGLTKVIIASGHATEEDIIKTKGSGRLLGYIKKPIEISKLGPFLTTGLQMISLQKLTENYYRSLIGSVSMGDMLGRSEVMQHLY